MSTVWLILKVFGPPVYDNIHRLQTAQHLKRIETKSRTRFRSVWPYPLPQPSSILSICYIGLSIPSTRVRLYECSFDDTGCRQILSRSSLLSRCLRTHHTIEFGLPRVSWIQSTHWLLYYSYTYVLTTDGDYKCIDIFLFNYLIYLSQCIFTVAEVLINSFIRLFWNKELTLIVRPHSQM